MPSLCLHYQHGYPSQDYPRNRYSDEQLRRRLDHNCPYAGKNPKNSKRCHPKKPVKAPATSAFGGNFESIDQIFLSRHFAPDNIQRIADMEYFSVLNDHLTDGSHPEAPYNKLASDHGQIIAHITMRDT